MATREGTHACLCQQEDCDVPSAALAQQDCVLWEGDGLHEWAYLRVPLPGQPALRQLLSLSLVVLAADPPLAHSVPEVEAAL